MKRLAVLLVMLAAGCTGGGGQSAGSGVAGGQGDDGQPRKMSSLRVNGGASGEARSTPAQAAVAPSTGSRSSNGTIASQSMNVTGGVTGIQIQSAGSNAQSMNVQANGGTVIQRQNGSGNTQSMNIGVTDDIPINGASVKP